MMKIILLACVLGVAKCAHLHGDLHAAPVLAAPVALHTGASSQYRSQDNVGNYAFGYNEDHTTGGTFRRESGDAHGNKVGSYGLRDADGRLRIVNYVADALGFRANIQTNEPGVEPKDPAATLINKAAVVEAHPAVHSPVIAPAPLLAAPITHGQIAHGHGHGHGHFAPAASVHAPLLAAPHYNGHYNGHLSHYQPAHLPLLSHYY